jgi:Kinesin motor domain
MRMARLQAVAPLIRSCEDGYNVTIFAYGQTGSGATLGGPLIGSAAIPSASTRGW